MLYQEDKLKTNVILSEKIVQGLEFLAASLEEIVPLIMQEVIENPLFDLDQFQNDTILDPNVSHSHKFSSSYDSDKQSWWENIPEDGSFLSQLKKISQQFFQDPIEIKIAEHITGSLNKNGCLSSSLEEIAILTETDIVDVQKVLKSLQKIFPLGIATLNLKQCVLVQLKEQEKHKAAYQIIERYFDDNCKCDLNYLSKRISLKTEELHILLKSALSSISFYSLEEKNIFYNKTTPPDIIAIYQNEEWNVSINQSLIPPLHTNEKYLCYSKNTNPNFDKFIKTHLTKAKNLIENIAKREQTLKMIFSYIVNFHSDFLLGSIKNPLPLTMKEISADLSLHVSTISRALKNKTLMCNGSIISTKQLVSSYTFTHQEMLFSPHSIKQLIKELIDKEDLNNPLSDKEISERITALKNIMCSRRTITKYRISLGIPSTFQRKKYCYKPITQNKKNTTASNASSSSFVE